MEREEEMPGNHVSYRNVQGKKKKKESGLDSVLCRGTVALWLMLVFCELPPAGCLPMGQHCPAQLHGRRGNSMTGAAALISLSQRCILSS